MNLKRRLVPLKINFRRSAEKSEMNADKENMIFKERLIKSEHLMKEEEDILRDFMTRNL